MILRTRDIIEQIRRGNVPEGYQKTKDGIFPTDWHIQKMKQWVALAERPVTLEDDKRYRLVTVRRGFGGVDLRGEYLGKDILVKNYFRARQGDFLISKRQIAHGACGVVPESLDGAVVSNEYNVFVPNQGTNIEMFNLMMQLPHYTRLFYLMSDGVHIEKLLFKTQDWMRRQLAMPPIEEQRKIAAILTTQDKVIELKEKCLAEKQRQKKYLMQQLLTGKKRLPGFSEEWKKVKIGSFIKEIDERSTVNNQYEILSVTKNGMVFQSSHFNKQIASENNVGYKVVRRGNLAFSTMNLWMGSLDTLRIYDTGIVSPAYKVFEFNQSLIVVNFAENYMKSAEMIWLYKANSEQGASIVRRNLDLQALLNSEVALPDISEQTAIAEVLSAADHEIDLLRQDIEQEKQKKKALMQLLLTGIVRVKI